MTAAETGDCGAVRLLAGRYRLTRLINCGGSGAVWVAFDEVLGREVAIKDVATSPYLDGPYRRPVPEHTMREARAAGRINHPGVVPVHDVVEEDGRPWIVMQLVEAPSLAELIERDGPLAPHRVAAVGLQLVRALRAAHSRGIVHRDVKPSNVLLDGERVVLTDFGIAMIEGEANPAALGTLVGAPSYIAPECVRGAPATPASDLWALGATLYAAVEGRAAYQRDDPLAALAATASDEPDPLRRAGALSPLLTQLLRREPAKRPSAAKVERQLRRLVTATGEREPQPTTAAAPVGSPTAATPQQGPRRRLRPAAVIALLSAVAALVTLVMGLVSPHPADDSAEQRRPSPAKAEQRRPSPAEGQMPDSEPGESAQQTATASPEQADPSRAGPPDPTGGPQAPTGGQATAPEADDGSRRPPVREPGPLPGPATGDLPDRGGPPWEPPTPLTR